MYSVKQYACIAVVAVAGLVSTYALLNYQTRIDSNPKATEESLLERAVKALEKSNNIDLRRK